MKKILILIIGLMLSDLTFADTTPDCGTNGWYWNGQYCVQCPVGFDHSEPNATHIGKCYFISSDGETRHYGLSRCKPGNYLPKGNVYCQTCPDGFVCLGDSYFEHYKEDQGKYKCPDDYPHSDGDRAKVSDCYYTGIFGGKHHYGCKSGKWYDTKERRCKDCPSGYPTSSEDKSIRPEQCFNQGHTTHAFKSCSAGKYLPENASWTQNCSSCPNGYVCPGGKFTSFTKYQNQGLYKCADGYKKSGNDCVVDDDTPTPPEPDPTPDPVEPPVPENPTPPVPDDPTPLENCGNGTYGTPGNCQPCPSNFNKSADGATQKEQCYAKVGDKKLYYKKVTCGAGKYLPKESGYNSLDANASNGCADCITTNNQKYCPGVNNKYPSLSSAQGYDNCPSGKVANDDFTACKTPSGNGNQRFTCDPGKYLPKNNNSGCIACTNTHKYCPGGGPFTPSSTTDQGIFDCPQNGVATNGFKSCVINLDHTKLKNGPNGTATKFQNQCWLKKDIREYAKCMFPDYKKQHKNPKDEVETEIYDGNPAAF